MRLFILFYFLALGTQINSEDLADYTVLGNQPEIFITEQVSGNSLIRNQVHRIDANEPLFLSSANADVRGIQYHHFWSSDGGSMTKAGGFNKIKFVAPEVNKVTEYNIYHWYGNGLGSREEIHTIIVEPASERSTLTVPLSASENGHAFTETLDIPNLIDEAVSESQWVQPTVESLIYDNSGGTRRSVSFLVLPNDTPLSRSSEVTYAGSGPTYEIKFVQAGAGLPNEAFLAIDSVLYDDDRIGNSDGLLNPGEWMEMDFVLANRGSQAATGISVSISTADPYVELQDDSFNVTSSINGGSTLRRGDVGFYLKSNTPDGHVVAIDVIINSDQGSWRELLSTPVDASTVFYPQIVLQNLAGSQIPSGSNFDFGTLEPAQSVRQEFHVSNGGTAFAHDHKLFIQGADSDQFAIVATENPSMAPGESYSISVIYAPSSPGIHHAEIVVNGSDLDAEEVLLNISGESSSTTGLISVHGKDGSIIEHWSPSSESNGTHFGEVYLGESRIRYFSVRNSGDATISLSAAEPIQAEFEVGGMADRLEPGEVDEFWVRFSAPLSTPSDSDFSYGGLISIVTTASNRPEFYLQIRSLVINTIRPELSVHSIKDDDSGYEPEWDGVIQAEVWEGDRAYISLAVANAGGGSFDYTVAVSGVPVSQHWYSDFEPVPPGHSGPGGTVSTEYSGAVATRANGAGRKHEMGLATESLSPGLHSAQVVVEGNGETFFIPVRIQVKDNNDLSLIGLNPISQGGVNIDWRIVPYESDSGFGWAGRYMIQTPSVPLGTGAWMELTFEGPGVLTFDWKASFHHADGLKLYCDGLLIAENSGDSNWKKVTHRVTGGAKRYRWGYERSQVGSAEGAGWLHGISFQSDAEGIDDWAHYRGVYGVESIEGDDDSDGWNNFAEWILGGSSAASGSGVPTSYQFMFHEGGSSHLALAYMRLAGGSESGAVYSVGSRNSFFAHRIEFLCSKTLGVDSWETHPQHIELPLGLPLPPTGYEWGCVRLPFSTQDEERGFFRMNTVPGFSPF